jgi:tetratricopeptide (TPR) repeat protein
MSILGVVAALLLSTSHAEELLPEKPSPAEIAVLPDYCKARSLDPHSSEFDVWQKRLGQKFLGIHHYCFGLNYVNRYFTSRERHRRDYYLGQAVPAMDYVMKDMPDSFPLAGEMYLNRGYAYKLMGNKAQAAADFTKAVALGPNQPQAYARLIDSYLDSKNKAKALEMASNGLAHLPGNRLLQRKYLELGGKEPFPKPVDGTATAASKEAAPAQADKTAGTDSSDTPAAQATPGDVGKSAQESGPKDVKPGDADSNAPKPAPIGVPGNPYCRFCP